MFLPSYIKNLLKIITCIFGVGTVCTYFFTLNLTITVIILLAFALSLALLLILKKTNSTLLRPELAHPESVIFIKQLNPEISARDFLFKLTLEANPLQTAIFIQRLKDDQHDLLYLQQQIHNRIPDDTTTIQYIPELPDIFATVKYLLTEHINSHNPCTATTIETFINQYERLYEILDKIINMYESFSSAFNINFSRTLAFFPKEKDKSLKPLPIIVLEIILAQKILHLLGLGLCYAHNQEKFKFVQIFKIMQQKEPKTSQNLLCAIFYVVACYRQAKYPAYEGLNIPAEAERDLNTIAFLLLFFLKNNVFNTEEDPIKVLKKSSLLIPLGMMLNIAEVNSIEYPDDRINTLYSQFKQAKILLFAYQYSKRPAILPLLYNIPHIKWGYSYLIHSKIIGSELYLLEKFQRKSQNKQNIQDDEYKEIQMTTKKIKMDILTACWKAFREFYIYASVEKSEPFANLFFTLLNLESPYIQALGTSFIKIHNWLQSYRNSTIAFETGTYPGNSVFLNFSNHFAKIADLNLQKLLLLVGLLMYLSLNPSQKTQSFLKSTFAKLEGKGDFLNSLSPNISQISQYHLDSFLNSIDFSQLILCIAKQKKLYMQTILLYIVETLQKFYASQNKKLPYKKIDIKKLEYPSALGNLREKFLTEKEFRKIKKQGIRHGRLGKNLTLLIFCPPKVNPKKLACWKKLKDTKGGFKWKWW